MGVEILALPSSMVERVAVDIATKIAYVDRRHAGDPLLLTWQDRNRSAGVYLTIKPVDVDEVAKLRANGMRLLDSDDEDRDKVVRGQSMEIIRKAAEYNASDIHLMIREQYTEIQVVIKGGLRVLSRVTHAEGEALTRAIYQGLATTRDASFNQLDFQNAQISGDSLPPGVGLMSVRIIRGSCFPLSLGGAFMTLRLQYSAVQLADRPNNLPALPTPRRPAGELKLGRMGYTPSQIEKLKILMDAPNGIVIFTGPTGTGKTTALFEVLQELARVKPHRRLVTIEEPVEYPMDWGIQLEVTGTRNDSESGTAFGDRLRVGLRMAPNIFLIGELRGPDVAIYALEASVTGHQVWTTMHVTDPFIFVERLELMDAERLQRRVFCDHKIVRGVVAQRLLAKLCQQCSVLLSDHPDALSKRIVTALGTWGDISKVRVRGRGCEHCGHDGTLERFAVAEVVITDAKLMADFINHGSDTARENYRAQRHADPSMLESGIMHSLAGIVDPRDVEEAIDLIEVKDRRRRHE